VAVERFALGDPGAVAAAVRALAPAAASVTDAVAAIVADVRENGDAALLRHVERFDDVDGPLRVGADEPEDALAALDPGVRAGLEVAIANVRAVAQAGVDPEHEVSLPQGQTVTLREVPVRRAAVYVPGGRAPYPSTVVMGAIPARVAGVTEIAVCAPPGPGGRAHPVILAACVLCEVTEVYRMGGAQAIAALAFGTESVEAVDVIVGPGNPYVQEAKRQLVGKVGIDGIAGPSELVVVASAGADPELIALDLMAQAEHGEDSPVYCISPDSSLLDEVTEILGRLWPKRPSVANAEVQLFDAADAAGALARAEEIAPEHLELVGEEAEALADRVRNAGCLFVGRGAATAFGDYVAGSNHVLPTGGAARFQSALSPATFRRRMARVSLPAGAATRLAPAGAALARAEGFPVHAESMERRA
jgi:histidinol dehydrogenase